MSLDIGGKEKYIKQLIKELEEYSIVIYNKHKWSKIRHLTLWTGTKKVSCFQHKADTKLNANLPSHRKHFIMRAKKALHKKD